MLHSAHQSPVLEAFNCLGLKNGFLQLVPMWNNSLAEEIHFHFSLNVLLLM